MSGQTARQDVLEQLHAALADEMKNKIASGEYTAADLNVIRQFLKDNNISTLPTPNSPLDKLIGQLPYANPEGVREEDEAYH